MAPEQVEAKPKAQQAGVAKAVRAAKVAKEREYLVVGKRITQVDGATKATGAARYTADIKLPGMLVGKVLRSPYPHAKIISIDGTKVKLWEDLQILVQERKENDVVRLEVLRGNTTYTFNTAIKAKELVDVFGKKYSVGLLGITPAEDLITTRHGLFESLGLGLRKTWDWTYLTYEALWRMITGKLSLRDSVTGPLGLFLVTSKAVNAGIIAFLHLVAILNINLAVFNLLPFPILDGGNILFIIIEKIRGKQISLRLENMINRIGLTLILTLVVVVTYNDIIRFFGDKIVKLIK